MEEEENSREGAPRPAWERLRRSEEEEEDEMDEVETEGGEVEEWKK